MGVDHLVESGNFAVEVGDDREFDGGVLSLTALIQSRCSWTPSVDKPSAAPGEESIDPESGGAAEVAGLKLSVWLARSSGPTWRSRAVRRR